MKKVALSMIAALGLATAATAQDRSWNLAPEVGLSIANVRGKVTTTSLITGGSGESKNVSADPTFGIKGGLNSRFNLTDRLSLQPGLFFVSKGAKEKNTSFGSGGNQIDNEYKYSVNYLELPVNVQYELHNNGGGSMFVYAGPYLGYAISGKYKLNTHTVIGGVTEDKEYSENMSIGSDDNTGLLSQGDDWKAIDYGFQVGLGYTLPMGLYFRGQYQMGLADVRPDVIGDKNNPLFNVDVENNQKNWGFSITAGYWLFR